MTVGIGEVVRVLEMGLGMCLILFIVFVTDIDLLFSPSFLGLCSRKCLCIPLLHSYPLRMEKEPWNRPYPDLDYCLCS